METLHAVGITPLSVLAKRNKPRKNSSLASIPPLKNQNLAISLSRNLQGGLVLLSTVLDFGLAKALTYDEALQQSATSSSTTDFDPSGVFDSVINFVVDNPLIVGGGAVILAVPLVVAQLLSKPKPWGVESAKTAYTKLADDSNTQLLDIRAPGELRQVGSPDVRGLKKKPVAVVYKGEDKPGFLKKLALKFKEPENTTLFILDKYDGNSELVAELVTANGFKASYAIKDGAEGPRGWMNSGLPWILPKKTLSLDISDFADAISDALGGKLNLSSETSDATSLTLGVVAAASLGLLAFTEVETILQLLGSAALIQFVSKKFLFAEDRKQTLQQVEEILNTKVAPKELVGDIQQIGKAILPLTASTKALPAPVEANPAPADTSVQKSESIPEVNNAPPKVESAPEPTTEVNSVPKIEVQEKSLPGISRPLSPYPNYPDYKPPSSPIPSQP